MMQMQKIKKLCLARGNFTIVNGENMQWLSDGVAVFQIPTGATINPSMLGTMFDLTDSQIEKCQWSIKTVDDMSFIGVDLNDNTSGDILLHEIPATISVLGSELVMLRSEDGEIALLIDAAELTPIEKYDACMYYARKYKSGWAVAAKNGYALIAFILPWRIGGDACRDTLTRMCDVFQRLLNMKNTDISESEDLLNALKNEYEECGRIEEVSET